MLLTVLVLSGTVLAVTTVAGILMVYQIRQTTNIVNSAKAIFAADTGLEWELYRLNKNSSYAKPTLSNRSNFDTTVSADKKQIKSVGSAGDVKRAFNLTLP